MVEYMRKGLGKNNYTKIVKIQGKAWENNGKAEKNPLLELSLRKLKRIDLKQKTDKRPELSNCKL